MGKMDDAIRRIIKEELTKTRVVGDLLNYTDNLFDLPQVPNKKIPTWTTARGEKIPYSQMSDEHIKDAISSLNKIAEEIMVELLENFATPSEFATILFNSDRRYDLLREEARKRNLEVGNKRSNTRIANLVKVFDRIQKLRKF